MDREMIIQEETGTAARRYSQRDCRLGVILLPESVFKFITFQEGGRMTETSINASFPTTLILPAPSSTSPKRPTPGPGTALATMPLLH